MPSLHDRRRYLHVAHLSRRRRLLGDRLSLLAQTGNEFRTDFEKLERVGGSSSERRASAGPSRRMTGNAPEGQIMYPGLSDADCRAAEFRLRQMRIEADQRRFVTGVVAARANGTQPATDRGRMGRLVTSVIRCFVSTRLGRRTEGDGLAPAQPETAL